MHGDDFKRNNNSNTSVGFGEAEKKSQAADAFEQNGACQEDHSQMMHAILPVTVTVGGQSAKTFAFYDTGSSTSFITDSFIQRTLNAIGDKPCVSSSKCSTTAYKCKRSVLLQ